MRGRVLVTGASGFIGRHAVAPLLERGYEVHAVGRGPAPALPAGARWHSADLLRAGAADELVARVRPTHLLHLAWYVEHGQFWHSPENLRWVGATLELVRAFAEAGGARAVLAGTCAEYRWGGTAALGEGAPLDPGTLYGASKRAVFDLVSRFARQSGLSVAWGRVFLLYGPHEAPGRLVPSVVRSLLAGEPALCSHGGQVRDFLHAADVAGAFVALLDGDATGAVNVGSGDHVPVRSLVQRIAERVGRPELLRLGALPAPDGDPPVLVADVSRLRDEVGWRPRLDLNSGLDDVIAWWRRHPRERA